MHFHYTLGLTLGLLSEWQEKAFKGLQLAIVNVFA